jgi:hypothetical protein
MALDRINATALLDGGVTTADIASGAVTSAKLDTNIAVTGTLSSGSSMTATGEFKANGGAVFNEDNTDVDFRVESLNNANMVFVDGGNDRVGVGTSSPQEQIHSYAGGSNALRVSGGANNNKKVEIGYDNTNGPYIKAGSSGETGLQFYVDNTSLAATIDNTGKVGIGTISPSELLEVNSTGASTAIEISAGLASTTTGESKLVLRSLHSSSGTVYSRSEIASLGVAGGDSDLIFRTTSDASGPVERMRIDSEGHVTMPYQPAFLAHPTSTITNLSTGANNTLAFATERFDQNSDYNNSTYTFTAPVTGKYQVNVVLYLNELDSAVTYYEFRLDTSNHVYYAIFDPDFGQDNAYFTLTFTALVDMDASDTADINLHQQGGSSQTDISSLSMWSMYLVA